jgi:hypothetical protein
MDEHARPHYATSALITIDVQRDVLDGQPLEIPAPPAAPPVELPPPCQAPKRRMPDGPSFVARTIAGGQSRKSPARQQIPASKASRRFP